MMNTQETLNDVAPIEISAQNHEIIHKLNQYVGTYPDQHGYESYSNSMVLNDLLYGIGTAFNDKYQFAHGFELFKKHLHEFLTNELSRTQSRLVIRVDGTEPNKEI